MELVNALLSELLNNEQLRADLFLEEHAFTAGERILEHGTISDRVHVIVSGQVRVYIEQEVKVQLALLASGQFFGEMSCLTGDAISAHVEAVDEVKTMAMDRESMLLLMDRQSEFRMQVIETMIKRIQRSNDRVMEEHSKSFLVMKQHEQSEQERYGEWIGESAEMKRIASLIEQLAKEFVHVMIVGESGTGKMNVARKLHMAATDGHYPLLISDAEELMHDASAWHAKARAARGGTLVVEGAERLTAEQFSRLLSADTGARMVLTSSAMLEAWPKDVTVIRVPPLRDRVEDIPLLAQHFVQKEGALDTVTAIAPDAMRMLALFPYLSGNVEELQQTIKAAYARSEGRTIYSNHIRFGRTRKPGERPTIGLALGSGSLRGLAHIGVLRVLEQERIPIDMIAGTSVGSLIGGAFAAGMSADECAHVVATLSWGKLVRPTFPKRSFVHNLPMIAFVESHIGHRLIEDLPMPFAAVASDSQTGEGHIMRTGSLAHAIAASTAIPAVMRPVKYQGKTLVDGAVVHPVPAALVKSMGADIVIAVNVTAESFAKGTARHFLDSLMNTIDIMSSRLVNEELQIADVTLRPDFGHSQISFKNAQVCFRAGEAVTQQSLEQIRMKIEAAM